jgi:hypothetical protein
VVLDTISTCRTAVFAAVRADPGSQRRGKEETAMKQEVPLTWSLWIVVLMVAGAGVRQWLREPPLVGWVFLGLAVLLLVSAGAIQARRPR